jgi:probable HAF family extracellular repeat protein
MRDLGTLAPGSSAGQPCAVTNSSTGQTENDCTSQANAINDAGETVGDADYRVAAGAGSAPGDHTSGFFHAFAYVGGAMSDLGTLAPGSKPGDPCYYAFGSYAGNFCQSSASDVNSSGDVVGSSDLVATSRTKHAFVFSNGSMSDLGVLPGDTDSKATAINDSGDVVGYSYNASTPSVVHAFVYSGGSLTQIIAPAGTRTVASDVNKPGVIVGHYYNPTKPGDAAFIYVNGQMVDLNSLVPPGSGWDLTTANSINDRGEIAGAGMLNGRTHAFLLSPPDAVVITAGPDAAVRSKTATFEFAVPGKADGSYECALDSAAFGACSSPAAYPGLADGQHSFAVRFTPAGASAPGPLAHWSWRVDTTPPTALISSAPSGDGNSRDATVSFSSRDPDGAPGDVFRCSLDGGADYACSSPQRLTQLDDGVHFFDVRAFDAVGNAQAGPTRVSWRVGTECSASYCPFKPKFKCPTGTSARVPIGPVISAVARDPSGCFRDQPLADGGHRFVTTGPISINGIDVTPGVGASVELDSGGPSGGDAYFNGETTWDVYPFPSFHATRFSANLLDTAKVGSAFGRFSEFLKFLGLPVQPPQFEFTRDNGGQTKVTFELVLPRFLRGIPGEPKPVPLPIAGQPALTAPKSDPADVGAKFEATLSNEKQPRVKASLGIKRAWLFGVAELSAISLAYDTGPPAQLELAAKLQAPGSTDGAVEAAIALGKSPHQGVGGSMLGLLRRLSFKVSGFAAPLGYNFFLQRLGAELETNTSSTGVPLVKVSGSAGVSFGPKLNLPGFFSGEAASIDGKASFTFPENFNPSLFKLQFTGLGKIVEVPVAGMTTTFTSNRVTVDGALDLTVGGYGVRGDITNSFFDWHAGTFNVQASGFVNLGILDVNADTVISSAGLAACIGPKGYRYGFGKRWGQPFTPFVGVCDVGPYTVTASASDVSTSRTAQSARSQTFTVARGTRVQVVDLAGISAPARAVLTGPGGTIVDATSDSPSQTSRAVVVPDAATNSTHIVLLGPPAGLWTVAPVAGSVPARIRIARNLPPVQIHASVTGRGARRVLHWRLEPQPGQRVTFVEEGADTAHVLATTSSATGSVVFTPEPATGRARHVTVLVTQGGLPREQDTVARFVAPPPQRLSAVQVLRLHGRELSWQPQSRAARYAVELSDSDGNRLTTVVRSARVVIPKRFGGVLRVLIGALGYSREVGPVGEGVLRLP